MSKTSYKVYVGEVGSAYTDKVQTAADYAAAVKNVADAEALIIGANKALTSAQTALTDAQTAMTEVKKAKINASAALTNLQTTVDNTRAAYEAAIEHSSDSSESSAIKAAKVAYEAAVLAYEKFDAILVDTDADLPALNSEDNYEDLLAATIEEIEAIIVRAQAVVEDAQAYKAKATADMEDYKTLSEEAQAYFESLLPEDFNKISPNEENDNIEREIQAKIDAVNGDVANARGVIDMINESTRKINNGISESGNTPVEPTDDSDEPVDPVDPVDPVEPSDEPKVYAYVGTEEVTADNFNDKKEEVTNAGYEKSLEFEDVTHIYIIAPAEGVEVNALTTTPFGDSEIELEQESVMIVDNIQYIIYPTLELSNIKVSIIKK